MQCLTPSPPLPTTGGVHEPVKITEADRMAWMRQYLGALEQWRTSLDTMLDSGAFASAAANAGGPAASLISAIVGTGAASSSGTLAPANPAPLLPSPELVPHGGACLMPAQTMPGVTDDGLMQSDPMAAFSAPVQAQYLQQMQFFQQMQAHENRGKSGSVTSRRFKDSFRPMRLCKHFIQTGICRSSDQCTFAHTYEELHPSSPDVGKMPELRQQAMPLIGTMPMAGIAASAPSSAGAEAGRCMYGDYSNNLYRESELGTKRPPSELVPPMKRRKEEAEQTGQYASTMPAWH